MPEPVEVNEPKFVLKDLDDLLLGESDESGGNIRDLGGDLTLNILFLFSVSLGPGPRGLALTSGRRRDGCSNPGLRLPSKAFQLELGLCLYDVSLYLGLLEVGLSFQ